MKLRFGQYASILRMHMAGEMKRPMLNLRVPPAYAKHHDGVLLPRVWYPMKTLGDTMDRWDRLGQWIAMRLPRWVVKWSLVRAGVHATKGQYSKQVVTDLNLFETMDRWENKPRPTDGWNPWNKVVHRDGGEVDPIRTNYERTLRGLPVPWHPGMALKEVGEGPLEVDQVEMALVANNGRGSLGLD